MNIIRCCGSVSEATTQVRGGFLEICERCVCVCVCVLCCKCVYLCGILTLIFLFSAGAQHWDRKKFDGFVAHLNEYPILKQVQFLLPSSCVTSLPHQAWIDYDREIEKAEPVFQLVHITNTYLLLKRRCVQSQMVECVFPSTWHVKHGFHLVDEQPKRTLNVLRSIYSRRILMFLSSLSLFVGYETGTADL